MNRAYCPKCGSTQYDTNHRCMNCGHAVWVESIGEMKRRQQEAYYKRVLSQNKEPAKVDESDKFETRKGIKVTWR